MQVRNVMWNRYSGFAMRLFDLDPNFSRKEK